MDSVEREFDAAVPGPAQDSRVQQRMNVTVNGLHVPIYASGHLPDRNRPRCCHRAHNFPTLHSEHAEQKLGRSEANARAMLAALECLQRSPRNRLAVRFVIASLYSHRPRNHLARPQDSPRAKRCGGKGCSGSISPLQSSIACATADSFPHKGGSRTLDSTGLANVKRPPLTGGHNTGRG